MSKNVRFLDQVSVGAFGDVGGNAVSASYAETSSFAQSGDGNFSGSFSGSFQGDGSQLTGITSNPTDLQSVMDVGSSATVATPINLISSDSVSFKSLSSGEYGYFATSFSTYFSANDGAGVMLFNLSTTTGAFFGDSKFSRGLRYVGDYSTNGIANYGDRWIPDYGAVKAYADNVSLSQIVSGSITASVSPNSGFEITSLETQILNVEPSGIVILATQSMELTGSAPVGAIYFTSGSMFIGLE